MSQLSLTQPWTPEDQQRYSKWTHAKDANQSIREKIRLKKEKLLALAEQEIDQHLKTYAHRERAKAFNKGLNNKYVPQKNIDTLDEIRGTPDSLKRSALFSSDIDNETPRGKVGRPNQAQIRREQAQRTLAFEEAKEANAGNYTNRKRKQLKQKHQHLNETLDRGARTKYAQAHLKNVVQELKNRVWYVSAILKIYVSVDQEKIDKSSVAQRITHNGRLYLLVNESGFQMPCSTPDKANDFMSTLKSFQTIRTYSDSGLATPEYERFQKEVEGSEFIRAGGIDEYVAAFLPSVDSVVLNISNVNMFTSTKLELVYEDKGVLADGIAAPIIALNDYIEFNTYLDYFNKPTKDEVAKMLYSHEYVKKNYRPQSCWLSTILDVYKSNFDILYKDKLTYESLARIFNPDKPLKKERNGYCFNEVVNFFMKYRLNLYLFDRNLHLRAFYETDRINKDLSPLSLYVVLTDGHIYRLNKNINSLSKRIAIIKNKQSDIIGVPKPTYNLREKCDNVNSMLANNVSDLIDILNNSDLKGDIYIVMNTDSLIWVYKELFSLGINTKVSYEGKMLFNTLVILNVNGKNLFIKNICEEAVTISIGYDNQQELKTYLDVSHWASNNLLQKSYLSTYSEDVLDMLEGYTRGPLIGIMGEFRDELYLEHRELDFNRFYTDILANLKFIPVVNEFDHFKAYDGHDIKKHYLYYVEKLTDDQCYPPEKFKLCWGFNLIGVKNIKIIHYLAPSIVRTNLNIREIIQKIYQTALADERKKAIMNKFSGMYIKRVNNLTHTSVFIDEVESQDFQRKYGGMKLLYDDDEFHINIIKKSALLTNGFRLIGIMIYDTAHKRLSGLIDDLKTCDIQVNAVNTDAVFIPDNDIKFEDFKKRFHNKYFNYKDKNNYEALGMLKTKVKHLPEHLRPLKYLHTDNQFQLYTPPPINHIHIDNEYDTDEIISKLVDKTQLKADVPGAGKTYVFRQLAKKVNTLMVVPTNALCMDLLIDGLKAITLHELLGLRLDDEKEIEAKNPFDISDFEAIVFDEIYLFDVINLQKIKHFMSVNNSKIFYASGCEHQNKAIQTLDIADYKNYYNEIMTAMFPNLIGLKKSKRCKDGEKMEALCKALREAPEGRALQVLLHHGVIVKTSMEQVATKYNISYFVKTCKRVNDHIQKIYHPNAKYYKGQMLVCRLRSSTPKLHVNYKYQIETIEGNQFTMMDPMTKKTAKMKLDQLEKHFDLDYCRTCHSYQGLSVGGAMTIFDVGSSFASNEWVYTAISRAKEFNQISIYLPTRKPVVSEEVEIRQIADSMIASHRVSDARSGREVIGKYVSTDWVMKTLKATNVCKYCSENLDVSDLNGFSIDRIDNNLPHIESNCQIICRRCNISKK